MTDGILVNVFFVVNVLYIFFKLVNDDFSFVPFIGMHICFLIWVVRYVNRFCIFVVLVMQTIA
jgi:hypothetical protein